MKRILPGLMMLALIGCGSDNGATNVDAPPAPTTISFTMAPANGTNIIANNTPADGVAVTVTVTNLTIVDPGSHTSNVSGEGHWHAYLDDASGGDYIALGFTNTLNIAIPTTTTAGSHRMHLQLQDNTHHPLPGVADSAERTFTVEAP